MKRIMKWIITICLILPMVRIINAGPHETVFTLTDGRTVSINDYKDDVVMVILYSAKTDENGNAVNANSASMLKSMSEDPLMDTEGLTVIAVAVEDMDPKKIDAFVDKYGRHEKILYAYKGQALLDSFTEEGEVLQLTECIIYVNGKPITWFDNNANKSWYQRHLCEYLDVEMPGVRFDLLPKVTYHQTEARTVLDMVNEFRTGKNAWYWNVYNTERIYAENLQPLVYDYDLEKAAMQRAAEVSVFFSHGRADGKSNRSTFIEQGLPDINGPQGIFFAENLAYSLAHMGPESAFTSWQETRFGYTQQGHRRAMLSDFYTSFAVAWCELNGHSYWAMAFANKIFNTTETPAFNGEQVRTVHAVDELINTWGMEKNSLTLEPGQKGSVSEYNKLTVRNERNFNSLENVLQWTSSDPSVLNVSGEAFTAIKEGTAVLSALAPDTKTTVQFTVTVEKPVPAAKTIEMHRLYNPNSWEHFYTGNVKEKDALVKMGWQYEGVGWTAPEKSNTPVYRLYNPNNGGDHHYTKNKKEYDALVKAGWIGEDVR